MKFPLRGRKSIFYFVKMKRIFLKKVLKIALFLFFCIKSLTDNMLYHLLIALTVCNLQLMYQHSLDLR